MIRLDIGGRPWATGGGFDVTRRVIVLGILVLVMLIPLAMIGDMVTERSDRRYQVESEIAGLWGGNQAIGGPVLAVPYVTRTETTSAGGTVTPSEVRHLVYFLPEALEIHADVTAERHYRSIYEALVYGTDVTISGRFAAPDFADWGVSPSDVQWSEATLSVGLTELRGIRSLGFALDDQPVAFTPACPRPSCSALACRPDCRRPAPISPGADTASSSGSPSTAPACWNSCPWAARPS